MKKLLGLLVIGMALTLTAVAQDTSMGSGQTATTPKAKKSKKAANSSMSSMDQDKKEDMAEKGMKGKTSSLTGCVSSSANSDGMYTLTNGRYKNGIEIGPTDKVQEHAGHKVALKGMWGADTKDQGKKMFTVDSVKHLAATCSTSGAMGSMDKKSDMSDNNGMKMKKGKGSKAGTTGAMGSTTPPPQI